MNPIQIELKHITKVYELFNGEKFSVLKDINLKIRQGDFVAIIGESGSGKSTLLNILALLDKKYIGEYRILGKSVSKLNDIELSEMRKKNVGFIFQDFLLLPNLTVRQNITLQMEYLIGDEKKQANTNYVDFLLQQVGLYDKQNLFPKQLSGGQKQRVAIARALLNRPSIIFADEPTGALDKNTSNNILDLLKKFNSEGQTVVMVTHDLSLASHANRKILVEDSSIIEVV